MFEHAMDGKDGCNRIMNYMYLCTCIDGVDDDTSEIENRKAYSLL
jgi:hypothetical protein